MTTPLDAGWALQQAIFTVLSADTVLGGLIAGRIYDGVPRGLVYPCLIFHEDTITPWNMAGDTASDTGSEHQLTLSAFSRAPGRKELRQIATMVAAALTDTSLSPDGFVLVRWSLSACRFLREEDGRTLRADLVFQAVLEAA